MNPQEINWDKLAEQHDRMNERLARREYEEDEEINRTTLKEEDFQDETRQ